GPPRCPLLCRVTALSLFKFPKDDNVRKRWIDFVKRSYCGEFKITTNTRLCSVHFTPDSYSNCHQVKSGYLKSPLTLVIGAELTLSVPGLHPPVPPTAGATIMAAGIMCPPATVSVPPTADALNSAAGIVCPPATLSVPPTTGVQILKVILHRAFCHAHVMLANVIAFNHDMIWPHSDGSNRSGWVCPMTLLAPIVTVGYIIVQYTEEAPSRAWAWFQRL
uniref:THAP domain-containing protein 1 n=1 Tax=Sparus aurata TaxID=8175 RepID=A0A671X0R3_SPAAU